MRKLIMTLPIVALVTSLCPFEVEAQGVDAVVKVSATSMSAVAKAAGAF